MSGSAVVRVAVQDANILIDLELAALLDLWRQTRIETHTTDLVLAQLRTGAHAVAISYVESGQIISHAISPADLQEVTDLMGQVGPGPDLTDCSVLWLAEKLDALLLTGDNSLRKSARSRHAEVHGTLWILDLLVELGLLTKKHAATKIAFLLAQERRLPTEECEKRIRAWSA